MYKLSKLDPLVNKQTTIIRLSDGAAVPMIEANTDYTNFKKDLADGVELQDAEGNVIDGIAYLEGLA
jgi:hypothetical protein